MASNRLSLWPPQYPRTSIHVFFLHKESTISPRGIIKVQLLIPLGIAGKCTVFSMIHWGAQQSGEQKNAVIYFSPISDTHTQYTMVEKK